MQHDRKLLYYELCEGSIAARDIVAQEAIFAINTLDDHVLRTAIAQHVDHALDFFNRNVLACVLSAEDDRGFGQIRREDVCAIGQGCHGIAEFFGVSRIDLAVVCHNGIDHAKRVGEQRIQTLNAIDLLRRAQKARIDGIQENIYFLPSIDIGLHHVGRVEHVPYGEGSV